MRKPGEEGSSLLVARNLVLRSCNEFDPSVKSDQNCLSSITTHYNFVKILGNGEYGVAIQVEHTDKHQPLVIKLMSRHGRYAEKDASKEVRAACKINTVAKSVRVFTRV